MKIIFILFMTIGFSKNAFTKELPPWVEKSAKIQSIEQFVEWMKNDEFYKITNIESKEIKIPSGQLAQETKISFEDITGCKNRELNSTCIPIGEDTKKPALFCQNVLSDCIGRELKVSQTLK